MASYYIQAKKTGRWYLYEQSYDNGKSVQRAVNKLAYRELGFDASWPVDRARERCQELNKQEHYKRAEQAKIAGAAQRQEDVATAASIYVPENLVAEFHKQLIEKSFGSPQHQKRIHSHFKTACAIINRLQVEPWDYLENAERFYAYFVSQAYSPNYVSKLLRLINMFGLYVSKKRGKTFEPVPPPNAHIKHKIEDTYQESDGFRGEADPLTPEMLAGLESKLPSPGHYRWLWVSVWLGLRPIEVDGLSKSSTWRVEHRPDLAIIWVYQSKLTRIPKNKRWKAIPLHYPEQRIALEYIQAGGLTRPLRKTLAALFPNAFITPYSGRKGFVNLMLGRGQPLEAIAAWLGHQDVSITWRVYRDKAGVLLGNR